MSDTPPKTERLSNGDIRHRMWEEDFFFSATKPELARRFLSYVLNENISSISFEELNQKLIAIGWLSSSSLDSPNSALKSSAAFEDWVCRDYLGIARAPSDFVGNLYRKAALDIRKIDERLEEYNKKTNELRQSAQQEEAEGEHEYRARFHEHFINLNKKAREEVIDFIVHGVNDEAFRLARKGLFKPELLFADLGKP